MITDLLRFFLKCCLFVLAVGGGYELAVYNNLFPHPPPEWVKFVGDARDASSNLAVAAAGLKEGTQNLVAPITSALQLANQIFDKQTDKVPNVPPVPAAGAPVPQVSVDVSKASAEAVKPLPDPPKKLEQDRKKKLGIPRKDPAKAVPNPDSVIQ